MKPSPLIPGFYPDPSICRSGENYYLVNSSFEYFPGVPLFHSRDLCNWRQIGHVLDRPSQLDLSGAWTSGGIYAPTIRVHDDTFYMITTLMGSCPQSGNFLVHTCDPFGEWSDPVWLPEVAGIDPDLFWDDDGTVYVQWSYKTGGKEKDICIGQARVDLESGSLLEEPRVLWRGTGGLGPEGPHIYKIDQTYYLCIAEGGTEYGHMQTLARSDSVTGPWESCPRNPVLTHRSSASAIHAVGHADWVQTPTGTWVGVCHGIRPRGYHKYHVLGRETFLFPITWGEDGWPVCGEQGMIPPEPFEIEGKNPSPLPTEFEDKFNSPTVPYPWNHLRTPDPTAYIRKGDGKLILQGRPAALTTPSQVTWIGVRQQAQACSVNASVQIDTLTEGEAGICVFQNLEHHFCIGVKTNQGASTLFTRIRLRDIVVEKEIEAFSGNLDQLWIQATESHYIVGITTPDGTRKALERCEARFLSTEVSGRFTGVYFALYAEADSTLTCTHFTVQETKHSGE